MKAAPRAESSRLLASLRDQGRRVTDQRRVILEMVRSTDTHPTAERVYHEVKKRVPRVSLGTVYRNLKLLTEQGLLAELADGHYTRYDGKVGSHHHFRCSTCGRIFDLDEPLDRRLEERVASRTGFEVRDHRIEFFGRCAACARSRRPSRRQRGR
ncbi:MAG TPA: transcriptional repressor [Methylomirabilota bacterium]|nr:transcriptional repressor [Methylomirabilota bacterium]